MNQFRKFMYGRYGFDQFTQFILGCAVVITLISTIARIDILVYLSYILLIYAVYRVISKNINKRTQENVKYLKIKNSLMNHFHKIKLTISGTKTHRYYLCPKCKQTIRVPKGKGKIRITCPKCRTEFIKRT